MPETSNNENFLPNSSYTEELHYFIMSHLSVIFGKILARPYVGMRRVTNM